VNEINSKIFFLNKRFISGESSYIWINTFSPGRGILFVVWEEGVILDLGKYGSIKPTDSSPSWVY
jgi:hypothetical protein